MNNLWKFMSAGLFGLFALGTSAALADHDDRYKPSYCATDHDHRSHASNYYNYYPSDRYSRAGAYRDSGLSFSITFGNDRYDRDGRYDRGRRHGYRGRDGRIIQRETFNTRYRAKIILIEEVEYNGRGRYNRGHGRDYGHGHHGRRGRTSLTCTVKAVGPEARYVSERRMWRIARSNCSPRSRIRVYA